MEVRHEQLRRAVRPKLQHHRKYVSTVQLGTCVAAPAALPVCLLQAAAVQTVLHCPHRTFECDGVAKPLRSMYCLCRACMYKTQTLIFKTFFAFYHDWLFAYIKSQTKPGLPRISRFAQICASKPLLNFWLRSRQRSSTLSSTLLKASRSYQISAVPGGRCPAPLFFPPAADMASQVCAFACPTPSSVVVSCEDVCKKDDQESARLASWSVVVPAW